jgi:hypothetical protein
LDADNFDQINDTTEIIFFKLLACQAVDLYCYSRVGLLLGAEISTFYSLHTLCKPTKKVMELQGLVLTEPLNMLIAGRWKMVRRTAQ